ncbi:MAG: hypothetical protein WAU07_02700 [Microgenomates group bacterium]
MAKRSLIVTHHAPDLDAIGATWLLVRFNTQDYNSAQFAFVNPGERISLDMAASLGFDLHEVVHVDTGLGKFDHHQPERGHQQISATSLVFDNTIARYPDLEQDGALQSMVQFITDIDHFGEIYWPESDHDRYSFMVHELLRGVENSELHDDESTLFFGMKCLDAVYANLTQKLKAKEIIAEKGQEFLLSVGKCLALETRNDDTIKLAQMQGYVLVIKKDPKIGSIRMKARPDSAIELKPLHEAVLKVDSTGTWYYHPSGKMLLNGSDKSHNQTPTPLTLEEIVSLTKKVFS